LISIPKILPDYYTYALIYLDIEHYVYQDVLVKAFRLAALLMIKLRKAYVDNNVIDFVLNLNQDLLKCNSINFIGGNRKTNCLYWVSMQGLLRGDLLNRPKQGGFIPLAILFYNDKIRDLIFKYILRSEVVIITLISSISLKC
jgi:asparagine synthase (glutamine-hydrolysing)